MYESSQLLSTRMQSSLFLKQSYMDSWDDYQRLMVSENYPRWDYIVLTASNDNQAKAYSMQIDRRIKNNLLPKQTKFVVVPDTEGKRIGSGGATLNVLRYIAETEKNDDPFRNKRILIIHSGGDSKRIPQYSACGKIFSPIPRVFPNGKRSSLFDEIIISTCGVPARFKEGLMVISGDVLMLFNSLQIEFNSKGATAISFKEEVEVGKDHGVYLIDDNGNVGQFLHKQTVQRLKKIGAVNEKGFVDIDTGAVMLSYDVIQSIYSLISTNGIPDNIKFNKFVNEKVRLSFYGDFLFPLASCSELSQYYNEIPENYFTDELYNCRTEIWNSLNSFNMRLLRLAPAKFIHFGTTHELHNLMIDGIKDYTFLEWTNNISSNIEEDIPYSINNSIVTGKISIGQNCYIENSHIEGDVKIGEGSILSEVLVNMDIPKGVVLHCLKQNDGLYVTRIYGVYDNPKLTIDTKASFLSTSLYDFIKNTDTDLSELWPSDLVEKTLWNANLYPVCKTRKESLKAAINIYMLSIGKGNKNCWLNKERKSLYSSFCDADVKASIDWQIKLRKTVKLYKMMRIIANRGSFEEAKKIFSGTFLSNYQIRLLEKFAIESDFPERIRIYYYTGKIIGGEKGEKFIVRSFESVKEEIIRETIENAKTDANLHIMNPYVNIKLPLRVNWGGGWSDTPPYCIENGGTVLNTAIKVNGQLPVEVCIKKIDEKKLIFESLDLDVREEFYDINSIRNCNSMNDPFTIHKAALITCGVIPYKEEESLRNILSKIGGGIYLSTQVHSIPKGSGLGTSSILASACVKSILEFFGKKYSNQDIYNYVLCLEQMMSTGGGWQDQVGGLTYGIKYAKSKIETKQNITIEHIKIPAFAYSELRERFAIIYTGQRRLARNLLRDIVGDYIGGNSRTRIILHEIQILAYKMKLALVKGDIDKFAGFLNQHWDLSKELDIGSSNTCIDYIFHVIDDLIDGRMICGAGGGGFLQVVMKKEVKIEVLRNRLNDVFQDSGVDVWECELI